MRRTKILATVGPATSGEVALRRLLHAGTDAFRLNFSHGTDADHRAILRRMRTVAERLHRDVPIVADLQGPKIRIGDLETPGVQLDDGAEWRLDTTGRPGDQRRVSVSLPELLGAAAPGDPILVGDGSIELAVERVEPGSVVAHVVHGGTVTPHAGIFLPRARLRTEILSSKDRSDLSLALDEGVDFVALSFVRDASDLRKSRRRLDRAGHAEVGLIAKIERAEALVGIGAILEAADGIMVARGDLGIEVPLERLALEQKRLVARANAAHRTVIVATQMLLSMISSPRPTRAEATDVANAVLDGADAVMLSEESAVGRFPTEAVSWLDRICRTTEGAAARGELTIRVAPSTERAPEGSVAEAAVDLAEALRAAAIVTPTHSGRTARLVARRRSRTPVIALSSESSTLRQLGLTWGVQAHRSPEHLTLLELRSYAEKVISADPRLRKNAPIVLTAGYPIEGRPTNLVTVVRRGDRGQAPSGGEPSLARRRRGSGPRRRGVGGERR